ncbi:lasso peptide biosynthesis PqqD family chaperone [Embleya sp. AB8]|uniref:lasso peptide biosynthesis PqqD family chaperone n=1 Tax=Embleya sp. AB8 TaxID=3156304 RepID=UPI003C766E2D
MAVRLRKHVSITDTEDGAVLLDERSGEYWQLNHSASIVLRVLLAGADEREAARALVEAGGPGASSHATTDEASDGAPDGVGLERVVLDIRELTEQLTAAELMVRT